MHVCAGEMRIAAARNGGGRGTLQGGEARVAAACRGALAAHLSAERPRRRQDARRGVAEGSQGGGRPSLGSQAAGQDMQVQQQGQGLF